MPKDALDMSISSLVSSGQQVDDLLGKLIKVAYTAQRRMIDCSGSTKENQSFSSVLDDSKLDLEKSLMADKEN